MTLLTEADKIFARHPLADDAPEQLDALIEQATGAELEYLYCYQEALYAAATPEQLAIWNAEADEDAID